MSHTFPTSVLPEGKPRAFCVSISLTQQSLYVILSLTNISIVVVELRGLYHLRVQRHRQQIQGHVLQNGHVVEAGDERLGVLVGLLQFV